MNEITKGKAVVYLVAIFLAGAVTGGVTGFSLGKQSLLRPPRPEKMAPRILDGLRADLNLSEEQCRQIEPLLERHCAEIGAFHASTKDRMLEMIRKSHEELGQFLTPEQKETLATRDRARELHFRKFGARPPPGPRPGPGPGPGPGPPPGPSMRP
jgi:hypothetical protein